MAVKTKSELDKLTNEELIKYMDSLPFSTFQSMGQADAKVKYFIAKFGKMFTKEVKGSGLFLSAVIPQSMYESFYGRSAIFKGGNNFGGVRYNKNIHDDFYQSSSGKWAKWKSYEDGVKGYIDNLKGKRYEKARKEAKSPEQQILMIHEAGYDPASDKNVYLNQVRGNIKRVRNILGFGRIE
jgi:flagellum-specific peptidoglycan hydrolase FlgJ